MADGRLILRSTKCTDRQKALAAAMEFERAAKLAGAGNLVEAQARKLRAEGHRIPHGASIAKPHVGLRPHHLAQA